MHVDQLTANVLSAYGESGLNLPTNYLVDANGVTLVATHGIIAEVLR